MVAVWAFFLQHISIYTRNIFGFERAIDFEPQLGISLDSPNELKL